MKKIVLLEKNQRVIDILKPALEREFSLSVLVGKSKDEISKLIDVGGNFSCVLARNEADDEFLARDAYSRLFDLGLEVPLITFGPVDFENPSVYSLPTNFKVRELFQAIKDLLGIRPGEAGKLKVPDFIPIPLSNFYLMNSCCCDVYIKIQKQGEDHFVKRIKNGDSFDKDVIKKYERMDLEFFYVKRNDHEGFLNQLLRQTVTKIATTESVQEHIDVTTDSYGISQTMIEDLKVSPQVVTIANVTIKTMVGNIEGSKFGSLLRDLLKNQSGFAYRRSYLISLLAHQIIPHMDWGKTQKQMKENFEKLVFVSFFHDLYLKEEEHLKIMSKEQLRESGVTGFQKNLINEHANNISTMVQKLPKAPPGADVIIRQHHGMLNGVGFSEYPSSSVSPMAVAFIVLEDFATELLLQAEDKKVNLKSIFRMLEVKYTQPSYKRVVKALKSVLIRN